MTVNDWYVLLQKASIWLALGTFVVFAGTVILGLWKDEEDATTLAAAQKGAAEAQLRAEEAATGTARARKDAADAAKVAADAMKDAADARAATAAQQQRAALAEQRLLELQRAMTPRDIVQEQVDEIRRRLVGYKGQVVHVVATVPDAEVQRYTLELTRALSLAGLDARFSVRASTFLEPFHGVWMQYGADRAPFALELARTLIETGIMTAKSADNVGGTGLELRVFPKPPVR